MPLLKLGVLGEGLSLYKLSGNHDLFRSASFRLLNKIDELQGCDAAHAFRILSDGCQSGLDLAGK